ncbi:MULTISPECIES: GspH/FimT family pseudopilin [unclassified Pseudomonas]|uniref:GspH/FimT family pseudopilin n=1 Tax=unclassified Pseudomonas TaxID=196821 RepID=UPI001313FC1A|nr:MULTISPECIES: GspH/FimT family pseudopilin [unclassified Pseudomonas]
MQKGLTLIELLMGLVVVGILAVLATPAFHSLIESQRRHDAAQQLTTGLRMARVEAIQRGYPVIVQASGGRWSDGWSVFVDTNRNRYRDENETTLAERNGHRRVKVIGNGRVSSQVGFDSSGRLLNNANGTLAVCHKDSPASHFQIAIAVTGRVTLRSEGFSIEPCA